MDAMQSLTGVGCGVCVFCGWRLLFLMVGCRQQIRILTKSSAFSACTALSFFYYFRVLYQVPSSDIVIAVKRVGPLKGLRCPLVVSPPARWSSQGGWILIQRFSPAIQRPSKIYRILQQEKKKLVFFLIFHSCLLCIILYILT